MVSKILKGSVHTFTKYFQHPDLERNSLVYMLKKKKRVLGFKKNPYAWVFVDGSHLSRYLKRIFKNLQIRCMRTIAEKNEFLKATSFKVMSDHQVFPQYPVSS